MIEFNITLLEELIMVDPKNEFLNKHDVKTLQDELKVVIQDGKDFNKQFEKPEKVEQKQEEKIEIIKKEAEPEEIFL